MKLTPELLRKIIKEEASKPREKTPVTVSPEQLRKIIVAESSRLLSEAKTFKDVENALSTVGATLPSYYKGKGEGENLAKSMRFEMSKVKDALKEMSTEDLEKTFKDARLDNINQSTSAKKKMNRPEGFKGKDFQEHLSLIAAHLKKSEHAKVKEFGAFFEKFGKSLDKYKEGGFKRGTAKTRTAAAAKASAEAKGEYTSGQVTKGTEVKLVQQALDKLGYDIGKFGADADYGPSTRKAIIKFQKDNKLTADGLAGPSTLKALVAKLGGAKGDTAPKGRIAKGAPGLKGVTYSSIKVKEGLGESVSREQVLSEGLADELNKMIASKSVVGRRPRRAKKKEPAVGGPKPKKGAEVATSEPEATTAEPEAKDPDRGLKPGEMRSTSAKRRELVKRKRRSDQKKEKPAVGGPKPKKDAEVAAEKPKAKDKKKEPKKAEVNSTDMDTIKKQVKLRNARIVDNYDDDGGIAISRVVKFKKGMKAGTKNLIARQKAPALRDLLSRYYIAKTGSKPRSNQLKMRLRPPAKGDGIRVTIVGPKPDDFAAAE